jgi:hypothetical protein
VTEEFGSIPAARDDGDPPPMDTPGFGPPGAPPPLPVPPPPTWVYQGPTALAGPPPPGDSQDDGQAPMAKAAATPEVVD